MYVILIPTIEDSTREVRQVVRVISSKGLRVVETSNVADHVEDNHTTINVMEVREVFDYINATSVLG